MSETSNMVKKEMVIIALLAGIVAGFIGGTVFAVYKLDKSSPAATESQASQSNDSQNQLDSQTKEAISNLESDVTTNPENIESWTRLGHLYFDTGQIKNAIKAYERSLELQPGNPNVLTDLGVMFRRDKQPEKAVECFEKAYSIQPDHAPSRLNKGIVLLYDFNKPQEAIATWRELLAIDPAARMFNGMPLTEAIMEIEKEISANSNR